MIMQFSPLLVLIYIFVYLSAPPPPKNVMIDTQTYGNSSSIVVRWDRPTDQTGLPLADENLQYKVYFTPMDAQGQQTAGQVVFRYV